MQLRHLREAGFGLLLTVGALFCAAVVSADDDAVTVIEGVAVLDDHLDEAIFYYENNWGYFRRIALERGDIASFEMIVGDDSSENVDIVLITRFASAAQYDAIEDRFQEVMHGRELKLLNSLEPGAFRKNVFVVTQSGARETAQR